MRFRFSLVMAATLALATPMPPRPVLAVSPPSATYEPDCTYNGVVQSCAVVWSEDSSAMTDNTVLIHWLDGEITSVWFLSDGSMDVGAKVILNQNKRGRITQVALLEDGGQRLHVKSETGNQLSFILSPATNPPLPGPDPVPLQP